MNTISLPQICQAIQESAPFVPFTLDQEFLNSINPSAFADILNQDGHLDAKIYPDLIAERCINIAGSELKVLITMPVAISVSLEISTGRVSGYVDHEYFNSAESEILFECPNLEITNENGEVVTVSAKGPQQFMFNDAYSQTGERVLDLKNATTLEASRELAVILQNEAFKTAIQALV